MRKTMLMVAAAVTLAACDSSPENQAAADDNVAAVEEIAPGNETVPAGTSANTAEPVEVNGSEAAPETELTVAPIPAALHGRWGLVPADCTSTRGDAKGLLTIDATTLRFYESRARVRNQVERSETRLVADFAFEGEGQEWEKRMVLDAQDGGQTLIRREYGDDAMPGPLKYEKCDA